MQKHERPKQIVEVPEATLTTFCYGNGTSAPVILIHGGPGMPGSMRKLGSMIQNDVPVVEYYQRDQHHSRTKGSAASPITFESHVDDLLGLIQSIKTKTGKKPVLMGSSIGAVLALEAAKKRSADLSSVVLLGLAPLTWDVMVGALGTVASRLSPELLKLRSELAEKGAKAATDEERLNFHVQDLKITTNAYFFSKDPKVGTEFLDQVEFHPSSHASTMETLMSYVGALQGPALSGGFETITVPVLHLHGTHDPYPYEAHSKLLSAALGNRYTLRVFSDCGHFPWEEPQLATKVGEELLGHLKAFR